MNYDADENDHDHDDVNPDDGGGGDCGDHRDDLYFDRYFNSNWIRLCMFVLVKDISVCKHLVVEHHLDCWVSPLTQKASKLLIVLISTDIGTYCISIIQTKVYTCRGIVSTRYG